MLKFVIDMMGGDNGVKATVLAVKNFKKDHPDIFFYCVGNLEDLKELKDQENISLVESKTILKMDVSPMEAMRDKDSSLFVACDTYLKNNCDALISAGSTGALVTLGVFKIKRLEGVIRPCIISPFPTQIKGKKIVACDLGANVENTSEMLVQFAKMGSLFYKVLYKEDSPKVYLLNNGTEEEKGNHLTKETYQLLKKDEKVNFIGNIEGRDALSGIADVIVTDGFTGNIFLKTLEGTAKTMSNLIKKAFKRNFASKIGYLFAKKGFDEFSNTMDYKSTGGAMLLGVNGLLVKAHGSSDDKTFYSSLNVALTLASGEIIKHIKEGLS